MPKLQVIGGPALDKKLIALARTMQRRETSAAFRRGAAIVRDQARQETPENEGLLKRAIISFGSKRRGAGQEPAAFARVNVLKGRIKAPHAHLIEFGTKERRPKRGKVLAFSAELGKGLGKRGSSLMGTVFARRVRPIRANPFFQRAVDKAGGRALDSVISDLKNIIGRTAEGRNVE